MQCKYVYVYACVVCVYMCVSQLFNHVTSFRSIRYEHHVVYDTKMLIFTQTTTNSNNSNINSDYSNGGGFGGGGGGGGCFGGGGGFGSGGFSSGGFSDGGGDFGGGFISVERSTWSNRIQHFK